MSDVIAPLAERALDVLRELARPRMPSGWGGHPCDRSREGPVPPRLTGSAPSLACDEEVWDE